MASDKPVTYVDGSLDFSLGVDSLKVPTIQSEENPQGLPRNAVAWLNNATVLGGGILPRAGWKLLGTIANGSGIYQGGYLYEPDAADPYLVLLIGGRVLKVIPDAPAPVDLSAVFGLTMPNNVLQSFMRQGENYLIIQAGDNVTLPLFWNGATLVRSKGITNTAVLAGTHGVNEIPAATAMDYYQDRLWYAQGRNYSAGDIVGGQSGTVGNAFRDSILNVTENPLVLGGDGFTVPTNAGNIRAIFHNANLNAVLGQGQLFIGTRKAIYAQEVPISRATWIAADAANQPKQTLVQLVNGPVNDRCIVPVNGDVFYQSLEPAIRSLTASVRNFGEWGNVPISSNEDRILSFNDRSLLHMASGVVFDNRLLQTALPRAVAQGVVHDALIPMDFTPIQNYGATAVPAWEGAWQGLAFFQLFTGDFGGLERCFGVALSKDSTLELWELTDSLRSDVNTFGESRVTWVGETPSYIWRRMFTLKKLVTAELWFDKIYGEAIVQVEYRVDQDPCWREFHTFKFCQARSSCEDVANPVCYPLTPYREGFRSTITLPKPDLICEGPSGRPTSIGYQFQIRLTVTGWCRLRGLLLHAELVERKLYENLVC